MAGRIANLSIAGQRVLSPYKNAVMKDDYDLKHVSKLTGVAETDLATAAEWLARCKPSAVIYSMGITQHIVGVDNVKSVANLMMLTGNIGKPGSGVNPLRDRTMCRAPAIWAACRMYTADIRRSQTSNPAAR